MKSKADTLEDAMVRLAKDPVAWVRFAYPWGQPGTLLEHEEGPDQWQVDVLSDFKEHIKGKKSVAFREAIASGHGIGKSALTSWLIQFFMSTRPHPQIVITANTWSQLSTKTWREMAKWHKLLINKDWFEWTATKFYHKDHPETWFASPIAWSKENAEAFAGAHEDYVMFIFDEASKIDDAIYETAEGAMTTPGSCWFLFGNPTQTTGRFKEVFPGGRFAKQWQSRNIDSRTAKKANREEIEQWRELYGEDSDFFRVRVRGLFPRAGSLQLIGQDIIDAATRRFASDDWQSTVALYPKVMGVDVARFGDDDTAIRTRQGPQIRLVAVHNGLDSMLCARIIAEAIDTENPDVAFVDEVGIGGPIIDRLHQLGYRQVVGVVSSEAARESNRLANKRIEMWEDMAIWLKDRGVLDPNDRQLIAELSGVEYGYERKTERKILESKKDMKVRLGCSPNHADAVAYTFAFPALAVPKPPKEDEDEDIFGRRVAVGGMAGWMA